MVEKVRFYFYLCCITQTKHLNQSYSLSEHQSSPSQLKTRAKQHTKSRRYRAVSIPTVHGEYLSGLAPAISDQCNVGQRAVASIDAPPLEEGEEKDSHILQLFSKVRSFPICIPRLNEPSWSRCTPVTFASRFFRPHILTLRDSRNQIRYVRKCQRLPCPFIVSRQYSTRFCTFSVQTLLFTDCEC
jgi:hypothetical protein